MEENPSTAQMNALREQLGRIEGVNPVASRPGAAEEGRFQGYVAMNINNQVGVERLLTKLGDPFWAIFHVDEQKCELGFRVEVTQSQNRLRYDLRFWGCPSWGLHRIRTYLCRRIEGSVARDGLPSVRPPGSDTGEESIAPSVPEND